MRSAAAAAAVRPRAGAAAALEALFARAGADGVLERSYVVAGRRVRMRFAGDAMLERIGGSFAHLETSDGGDPDLTVDVWDSATSETDAPPILGGRLASDGTGPVYYFDDGRVRALNRWGTLAAYDTEAREGWFWAPDSAAMLSWDWASPLRAILHWWLGAHGILQVHGGAVGTRDGGVLVVGRGGSGKSTTSLASLLAGLAYAGDDFVAVQHSPEPYVHSLYSSGKLETHQLERFPQLAGAAVNPERTSEEKAVIYATRVDGATAVAGFPLRAVLVPRIVGGLETRVVPASRAAALAALAPSTIFQLHPPQENALAEMSALLNRVPCYSLELGTELDRIPQAIAELLDER